MSGSQWIRVESLALYDQLSDRSEKIVIEKVDFFFLIGLELENQLLTLIFISFSTENT